MQDIFLAVNTDVAGYLGAPSCFSLYGCSEQVSAVVRQVMTTYPHLMEGPQWYQSDHSVFIQQGIPALAITSEKFMQLSTEITHTPKDDLDLVDHSQLVEIVLALREMIDRLNDLV